MKCGSKIIFIYGTGVELETLASIVSGQTGTLTSLQSRVFGQKHRPLQTCDKCYVLVMPFLLC